jgi:hypothetical protein
VARLELALRRSYHAADADAVPAQPLQSLAPERFLASRIAFAPAARLLRSRWPVATIWAANARGGPQPRAAVAEDVLITRAGYDPEPVLLPTGAGPFIAALMNRETVSEALEKAPEFDLTATLGILLSGAAITGTS